VLKDARASVSVQDLYRKHGISDATFYKWRTKYTGLLKLPRQGDSIKGELPAVMRTRKLVGGIPSNVSWGPLFVVLPHPLRTDLAHLIQRLEQVGVEHLMAERSIELEHSP